jgi:hypothetical protein
MKKLALLGFMLGMFGTLGLVAAADKDDPTGTWKWKAKFGKREVDQTLKLKNEDGKLSGTLATGGKGGKGKDVTIEDAKFKDGEVSFSVTVGKDKTVVKYTGKLSGDAIKGSYWLDGKDDKTDWEAKRDKE